MKTLPSLIKLVVFIVVTVLATGLLAATIGNLRFGGTTSYQALFTDATGLLKGDDVPDLATLLFGPMARGTAVGQS